MEEETWDIPSLLWKAQRWKWIHFLLSPVKKRSARLVSLWLGVGGMPVGLVESLLSSHKVRATLRTSAKAFCGRAQLASKQIPVDIRWNQVIHQAYVTQPKGQNFALNEPCLASQPLRIETRICVSETWDGDPAPLCAAWLSHFLDSCAGPEASTTPLLPAWRPSDQFCSWMLSGLQ